ncbi:dnc [Symbiodinium natans]|uniref:Dnc protein n=1 Tax=Symbiodinium natans TaxID=878477 RepID=A0A812IB46_9DINO|nr:dnc [Symbiodinium natans]
MATFGPDDVKVFSEAPSLFVYEHAGDGDSIVESQAIVLLKREHGLLLLLPAGAIPEEELVQGVLAPVPDLLGPSRVIELGAVRLVGSEVVPVADMVLTALLVDFSTAVLAKLYAVNQAEDPELLLSFCPDQPDLIPDPSVALQVALEWAQQPQEEVGERLAFYSADELPPPVRKRPVLRLSREDPLQRAAGLDTVEELAKAQAALQQQQLLQPSPPPVAGPGSTVAQLAECEEAAENLANPQSSESPLAQAVLAQSQALTALVAQLSTGDTADLSLPGASVGARGANQRAKLQEALASNKGVFYHAVLQNMARRMSPASSHSSDPAELLSHGVCLTRYWERFGGFHRAKDLGILAFQVANALDAMQAGKTAQAADHLALLAVCLEQGALDGGRLDLGFQLTFLEEPPAALFSDRALQTGIQARAFAPLAAQRWVAVVLAYMKELEVITSRRPPALSGDTSGDGAPFNGLPPPPSADVVHAALSEVCTASSFFAALPRWLVRTRTPFSAFLAFSFRSPHSRCGTAPASAIFPLPAPFLGIFQSSGPRLAKSEWRRLRLRRALHCVVMALNFLHDQLKWPSQTELLWRHPNPHQRRCFKRIWKFLIACDSRQEQMLLVPGRSGPELVCKLLELEHLASAICDSSQGSYASSMLEDEPFCEPPSAPQVIPCPGVSRFLHMYRLRNLGLGVRDKLLLDTVPSIQPDSSLPQLQPYRPLDVSRLRISGRGNWDAKLWLDGVLWLPYQEPKILQHGLDPTWADLPDVSLESPTENHRLALLWSTQNILHLKRGPPNLRTACRVFNAFKDDSRDRQIGDRRAQNCLEYSISGPSKNLPCGAQLVSLLVKRYSQKVVAFISDRKDFYHQMRVSEERACSNALGFSFSPESFDAEGSSSVDSPHDASYAEQAHSLLTCGLEGHRLASCDVASHNKRKGVLVPSEVTPCFMSLFQGDHLGVEYALEAHSQLLSFYGALPDGQRLLGGCPAPLSDTWAALVIDDFVSLSVVPAATKAEETQAAALHRAAICAYKAEEVMGSPEKDVIGATNFKAIGAEVISGDAAVRNGLVTAAAPESALTSCCPLFACGQAPYFVFEPVAKTTACPSDMKRPIGLSRRTAQELALCGALMPLFASDLCAEHSESLYATDASLGRGAICKTTIPRDLSRSLWLSSDRKGGYSRLDFPARANCRAAGIPLSDEDCEAHLDPEDIPRAPEFILDLIEICGGSAVVSKEASELGLVVGPPIDISESPHFDILDASFGVWLGSMLSSGRARSLFLSPPCATFSPAAYPKLGTPAKSERISRGQSRIKIGSALAQRCLAFFCIAWYWDVPTLFVTPRLSRLAWTRWWKAVAGNWCPSAACPGIENIIINDCLCAAKWQVTTVIPWRSSSHINVLELASLVALLRNIAREEPDARVTALSDSSVAKSALAKGRSTSRALTPALQRATALQLAFGLYLAIGLLLQD